MSADLSNALASWLSEQEGQPVEVQSLELASAGARRLNALFHAMTTRDGQTVGTDLALTMIPRAAIQILDVSGEAAIRNLAESAGVPVPHVHHVCTDESVLGGPFFISTGVAGETVPRRVLRLVHSAGIGPLVVAQLGTAMAKLHGIPLDQAPSALAEGRRPRAEKNDSRIRGSRSGGRRAGIVRARTAGRRRSGRPRRVHEAGAGKAR